MRNNSVMVQNKKRRNNNGGSIGATHSLELPGSMEKTVDASYSQNVSPGAPGKHSVQK